MSTESAIPPGKRICPTAGFSVKKGNYTLNITVLYRQTYRYLLLCKKTKRIMNQIQIIGE